MVSRFIKNYTRQRILAGKLRKYLSGSKEFAKYSLLSTEPPIFFVSHWMNEDLAFQFSMEKIFQFLKNRKAYFFYFWCWHIDQPERVSFVRHFEKLHREKYPKHKFVHLCNSTSQHNAFNEAGLNAIFCNHNAFIDESLFKPLPAFKKKYDAIYDSRFKDYKRHYLATEIENLALLYDFNPEIDNPNFVEKVREMCSGATFLNHHDSDHYKKLSTDEVNQALNASKVGLCLSAIEGAMYASIQYLLSGIPIVSTRSKGGRDVFFNDEFALIVEDNPTAVADGVKKLISLNPSPEKIRQSTINKIQEYRNRFIAAIQKIYDSEGIERQFASEWNTVFFNKLCKYQAHSDVIERLKKAPNIPYSQKTSS